MTWIKSLARRLLAELVGPDPEPDLGIFWATNVDLDMGHEPDQTRDQIHAG